MQYTQQRLNSPPKVQFETPLQHTPPESAHNKGPMIPRGPKQSGTHFVDKVSQRQRLPRPNAHARPKRQSNWMKDFIID